MSDDQRWRRRPWPWLLIAIALGAMIAWWQRPRQHENSFTEAHRTAAPAASIGTAPPTAQPARMVEAPREDFWQTLSPETQHAVAQQMGVDGPPEQPEEIDQGKNGVMTRLPSRYRPVTVATLHNGKLVIGEVMNIPPEQVAPQSGASTPAQAR